MANVSSPSPILEVFVNAAHETFPEDQKAKLVHTRMRLPRQRLKGTLIVPAFV